MTDVTRILSQIAAGDPLATDQLLPLVYDELRRMAAAYLARENSGQTLQGTALVHEAYLRLVSRDESLPWAARGQFFAAAAEAMRRILVDNARRKKSLKRGKGGERVSLDMAPEVPTATMAIDDLLALDEALRKLEQLDPLKAQIVQLRYFAGLSIDETAQAVNLSRAALKRHWVYARSWLYGQLHDG